MKCLRTIIESFLQNYSPYSGCNTSRSSQLLVINLSCDEHSKKHKVMCAIYSH